MPSKKRPSTMRALAKRVAKRTKGPSKAELDAAKSCPSIPTYAPWQPNEKWGEYKKRLGVPEPRHCEKESM